MPVRTEEFQERLRIGLRKGQKQGIEERHKKSISKLGELNPNWGGKSVTEETRIKRSIRFSKENNPFYGKEHTKGTREKMSEVAKLRTGVSNPFYGKCHSEETKAKLAESSRKTYLVTFFDGVSQEITNLKVFCEENNLHYSNARKAACGLINSYKGWIIRRIDE